MALSANCKYPASGSTLTYDFYAGVLVIDEATKIKDTYLDCEFVMVSPGSSLAFKNSSLTGLVKLFGSAICEARDSQVRLCEEFLCSRLPQMSEAQMHSVTSKCATAGLPTYEYNLKCLCFHPKLNLRQPTLPIGHKLMVRNLNRNCLVVESNMTIENTYLIAKSVIIFPEGRLTVKKCVIDAAIVSCDGSAFVRESSIVRDVREFCEVLDSRDLVNTHLKKLGLPKASSASSSSQS